MADLPPSRSRISGPSRTRIGGGGRGGGTCRTPPTRGSSASWPGRASPARTAGASCSYRQSSPSLCRAEVGIMSEIVVLPPEPHAKICVFSSQKPCQDSITFVTLVL